MIYIVHIEHNEIPRISCLFIKIAFLLPIDLQGLLYLKTTRNDPLQGHLYGHGCRCQGVEAGCGGRPVTGAGGVHRAQGEGTDPAHVGIDPARRARDAACGGVAALTLGSAGPGAVTERTPPTRF
jgi:hypothetical protein